MPESKIIAIPCFCEPASSLTHLAGACVFALLSISLLRRSRGSRSRVCSVGIFALAAVSLLSVSGVYHALGPDGTVRAMMLRIDSAAIFVLIAATYTPIHAIQFTGLRRWPFLACLWILTAAMIVLTMIYFADMPRWLMVAMYLGLGWIPATSAIEMCRRHGFGFIEPILWGGVAYTVGATLNIFHAPNLIPGIFGYHEIWHIAVLVGLGFHWQFVYQISDGRLAEERLDAFTSGDDSLETTQGLTQIDVERCDGYTRGEFTSTYCRKS